MENQPIKAVNKNQITTVDETLSTDEFSRLMARYRSVGYETYYDWKLAQLYQQLPHPINISNPYPGALSNN